MSKKELEWVLSELCRRAKTSPPNDECGKLLLQRAIQETLSATNHLLKEAKQQSLALLLNYGWKDVFKESLTSDGLFKTKEEAGRFEFCAEWKE